MENNHSENKKRILFVANVAKEHINKFHSPTMKAFRENGWEVDVACSKDADILACDHQYGMSWKRSPFTFKTIKGIFELRRLLSQKHYDVIYCHTPVGGLVSRLAAGKARKNGTKLIYCAHGFHFFKGAPIINWMLYYPLERFLAHFTDVIFTVNKEDYSFAHKMFTKKTLVKLVPEVGVSFDRLKIENPKDVRCKYRKELSIDDCTTVLIYVAELIKNKNQKMLIDTVKILLDMGEDVKLLLPGPDHADGEIQSYASSLGLSDYVITLGWRNDIGELMYASDICTASSIREGFGINLIEAMYCGLPVIATKNRGHEMIIDNNVNGYLVEINDSQAMAKRVQKLIHDEDTRIAFSNCNVNHFDCNVMANTLYKEIVDLLD